jgi:hypothetical protein
MREAKCFRANRPTMSVQAGAKASPTRSIWRVGLVVALAGFILGLTLPNLYATAVGYNQGILSPNIGYVFTSIIPDSPEARAGLRAGDKVDIKTLSLSSMMIINGNRFVAPNGSFTFDVIRNGRDVPITIKFGVAPSAGFIVALIKRGAATLFVLIAAALLLLRPSRMLWGFFLYSLATVGGSSLIASAWPPSINYAIYLVLNYVYYTGFLCAGLWMFVSRFPDDRAEGGRARVDGAAIPTAIALTLLGAAAEIWLWSGVSEPPLLDTANLVAFVLVLVVAAASFIIGYAHLRAESRQRFKWVLTGFFVSLIFQGFTTISGYLPNGGWPAAWSNAGVTSDVLWAAQIIVPLTVAYAVLKHRVLDVNFVISRALVYGVLTTLIVILFAAVDFLANRFLQSTQLALTAELGVAIAMGLSLNRMHRHVDAFADAVLFRQRHIAEKRLLRIADGLPHADSSDAVDDLLVSEPVSLLGLTSAAIFRRRSTGAFARVACEGWGPGTADSLSASDVFVLAVQGERRPFRMRDLGHDVKGFPSGAAAPTLAIPLIVCHQLEAIALYGPHRTGEDLDPDAERVLGYLTVAAAAAYDHIEANALRQRNEELTKKLEAVGRLAPVVR